MRVTLSDPPLDSTKKLLALILQEILKNGNEVEFHCPAGEGQIVMQRLRVMMSRERNELRDKGIPLKKFKLHSSVKTIHNASGKRVDECVCWKRVTDYDIMSELMQGMLSNES